MRRRSMLICLLFCAVLSGCATRGPVSEGKTAQEAASATRVFSEQVSTLPEGATQYFAESPFGPATVDAGPFYISGLGNECRSARVSRGSMSHRFALCKEENGSWRFIPTIFESMPR